jgi:hypothetical protein
VAEFHSMLQTCKMVQEFVFQPRGSDLSHSVCKGSQVVRGRECHPADQQLSAKQTADD